MKSIRARLITGLLAGFGLLLAGGGAALYFSVRTVLSREFDAALQAKAQVFATLTKQDGEKIELEFAEELMPEFQAGAHPSYFQLWRPDGRLLERSPSLGESDLPRRVGQVGVPHFSDLLLANGRRGRSISFAFMPQREDEAVAAAESPSPPASVVVAVERSSLDHHLRVMAAATAIAAILMMAGAVVLALAVIRDALRPLSQFASHVGAIDAATLHTRLAEDRLPTELEPICQRINELLARLQSAFARERHFSADVAHELRTPVAELRTIAEVAVKWPIDDPETQRAFADALAISEQMEAIVSGLLFMARCESGMEKVQRERIALEPFLRETWQAFAAQAQRKAVFVGFDLPPDATIESDRALLRIIVRNFLSNAAEYAPENGEIRIAVIPQGGAVTLRIVNPAADLSPADLPHIFERFWRKTNARTSSTRAGLGLSISRAAAQLLGAELHAEIPEPGRFAISLMLPSAR